MPMEAEVPMLFLICFSIVFAGKLLIGSALLLRRAKGAFPLFFLHLATEFLSFRYFICLLFQNRFPVFSPNLTPSINNSEHIGMFGVFWFLSVCFLLGMVACLLAPEGTKPNKP